MLYYNQNKELPEEYCYLGPYIGPLPPEHSTAGDIGEASRGSGAVWAGGVWDALGQCGRGWFLFKLGALLDL